jgi:hypothetical protein
MPTLGILIRLLAHPSPRIGELYPDPCPFSQLRNFYDTFRGDFSGFNTIQWITGSPCAEAILAGVRTYNSNAVRNAHPIRGGSQDFDLHG